MSKPQRNFYIQIVLPSVLGIVLFVVSVFWLIIPVFEQNMMDRKKEMIRELTNTAWSLLEEYHQDIDDSLYDQKKAQKLAAQRIEKLRYGDEKKDYFWIIDNRPVMIMHPYRKDLNNKELSDYSDPGGTKLFVEAVRTVQEEGEGYIHYQWQWKDDSSRIVPKLSYVKGFEPWNWIIGTGIYLEDVKEEMQFLKGRIVRISFIIVFIIGIIVFWLVRQSLKIETRRGEAEEKLRLSRLKYKSLVEASTEGTIMLVDGKITFSNVKFQNLLGASADKINQMEFSEIFAIDFQTVKDAMDDPNKSATFETRVKCFDKYEKDMVISVSKVNISGKDGYIIVAKDLSRQKMMEKETELLSEQLQTSLLFMNYPIADFVSPYIKTGIDSTLEKSVDLMTRKNVPVFLVSGNDGSIVGMVTDSDLRKRVIQKKLDLSSPVAGVMTAPIHVISEKALLYEALLLFNREQLNYLCVKNDAGQVSGLLVKNDVLEFQVNATGYMLKEIEYAENVNTLKKIYNRIPPLVNALLESGAKTSNINRIITSVSDAVTCRIIDLAMEEMEQPLPCKFALMVMGSEGRMEQTLYTDQDNAIVFENVDEKNHEEVQEHFLKLAEKINFGLNEVGYNFCKGEIMAKNKKWCQALSGWKEYFSHWIHDGDPQSLLDASIFFDFRIVYGEKQFEKELYTHINKTIDNQAAFFHQLVQPVLNSRLPSATSGSNQVNIKKVLFPLTGFARVYALKNKVNRTNTLERLQKLHEKSVLQTSFFNETIQAYSFLMAFRFRFQSDAILKGELPDNLLDVDQLTDIERNTLKNVLSKLGELQTKLSFDFKGG